MARFAVKRTAWCETDIIELYDSVTNTRARIAPTLGANLFSLTASGEELLRTPPDAETLGKEATRWGTPVLMPPNRIAGGRFTFNGRPYQFELNRPPNHNHGLVVRRAWQVGELAAAADGARVTCIFRAEEHPEVMAQFPHPFTLELRYTLVDGALLCRTAIHNRGGEPMPFGLGFHAYVAAPGDGWQIRLTPASERWELIDSLPTGRFLPAEGPKHLSTWQSLHGVSHDDGYRLLTPGPSRFELRHPAKGRHLVLTAGPQFGHWVIYNGAGGEFVCPEPYTCMTDAFNLDLPPAVSGMAVIAPGERRPAGDWQLQWQPAASQEPGAQ